MDDKKNKSGVIKLLKDIKRNTKRLNTELWQWIVLQSVITWAVSV
jgi:hypothetical protein